MSKFKFDIPGIEAWVAKSQSKSLKVVRGAYRELSNRIIDDAPVDTGFMVASAKARLNPKKGLVPRKRPDKYWEPEARELKKDEVRATSNRMRKLGDTLGLSFAAEYTKFVHEGTANQAAQPFIAINLGAWPSIVRAEVSKARKK